MAAVPDRVHLDSCAYNKILENIDNFTQIRLFLRWLEIKLQFLGTFERIFLNIAFKEGRQSAFHFKRLAKEWKA